jgi:hypothetical protein
LTSLGLNLEKLGLGTLTRVAATLAWAVGPAAKLALVTAAMPRAAAPSNEAAFRGDRDMLMPPTPARSGGSLDVTEPASRV